MKKVVFCFQNNNHLMDYNNNYNYADCITPGRRDNKLPFTVAEDENEDNQ